MIHINSPISSGKSTIGSALAHVLPHTDLIEGDDHGAPEHLPREVQWAIAFERIEQSIRDTQCQYLVVAYPIDESQFLRLNAACRHRSARLVVVTLAPPMKTALADRGVRKLTRWERERIIEMYAQGYQSRSFTDVFIDTSRGTVNECVNKIRSELQT
ncbi:ATP-binding protein [Pandoraea terrigena]|uniref:ATP-binding protein n=1 Tax=Pandoraea terrigena TaxID=2508292 RepID=UPI001FEB0BAF|nr:ATP-binding protein [Pandoraea terrigena]